MTSWTLLLALLSPMAANVAVEQVPGFKSEHACQQAGEEARVALARQGVRIRTHCVRVVTA